MQLFLQLKLLQEVQTRWKCVYTMLEHLLDLKDHPNNCRRIYMYRRVLGCFITFLWCNQITFIGEESVWLQGYTFVKNDWSGIVRGTVYQDHTNWVRSYSGGSERQTLSSPQLMSIMTTSALLDTSVKTVGSFNPNEVMNIWTCQRNENHRTTTITDINLSSWALLQSRYFLYWFLLRFRSNILKQKAVRIPCVKESTKKHNVSSDATAEVQQYLSENIPRSEELCSPGWDRKPGLYLPSWMFLWSSASSLPCECGMSPGKGMVLGLKTFGTNCAP